jgi:hypothetical protein
VQEGDKSMDGGGKNYFKVENNETVYFQEVLKTRLYNHDYNTYILWF